MDACQSGAQLCVHPVRRSDAGAAAVAVAALSERGLAMRRLGHHPGR